MVLITCMEEGGGWGHHGMMSAGVGCKGIAGLDDHTCRVSSTLLRGNNLIGSVSSSRGTRKLASGKYVRGQQCCPWQ